MINPYPNLPHQIRNYVLNSVIGKGGFAYVYKATHTLYHMEFALKVVCKSSILEKNGITYEAEISSLTKLDHPNVIKLYDFFVEDDKMFLVLEYCSCGTLEERILKNEAIPNAVKFNICTQIISALKYCYDMSIAHQDIKTSNILFDNGRRVKIADFGLSEFIEHDDISNQHKGTLSYLAPEVCQQGSFDPFKSDMWSTGVLFYRLFTNEYPFEGNNREMLKNAIINGFYKERLTGCIINPVRKLLLIDPDNRLTINKLSQMKLFADPLKSLTLSSLPRLNNPFVYSLNVKLGKKKSSLLYNQKFSGKSNVRHHLYHKASNQQTFL